MEFDDYKIEPNTYQEMAKAYFCELKESDFKFVKINTNKIEKQNIINALTENVYKLDLYIQQLQKTNKAKNNKTNLAEINQNLFYLKNIFEYKNTDIKINKTNLCNLLKTIIKLSTQCSQLCLLFFKFSQNEIDEKVCNSLSNFLEIIKYTTPLFGECHYRY